MLLCKKLKRVESQGLAMPKLFQRPSDKPKSLSNDVYLQRGSIIDPKLGIFYSTNAHTHKKKKKKKHLALNYT